MKKDIKISIVDHTINEVIRLGVNNPADVRFMLSVLKKYSLDAANVSLNNLEKNMVEFEADEFSEIMRCRVRCSGHEIFRAKKLGFSKIVINTSFDPFTPIQDMLEPVLQMACSNDQEIYLSIDNALEFSIRDVETIYPLIAKYGIKRLILGDRSGKADPFTTYDKLGFLWNTIQCPVEYVGYNDYGTATANTLSALRAGVEYVATAVSGIGIPGVAAMEEVLMAARHLWKNEQVPDGYSIAADCENILYRAGIMLPGEKAIIGKNVFAHESGIHVDGVLKNPDLYEAIKPEEVGLRRLLVIGKHSGTASLAQKLRQLGLSLSPEKAAVLLEKVRNTAILQKKPLTDLQLKTLYDLQMESVKDPNIHLSGKGEMSCD
ncbi:Homocitrate synthase 1 [Methanosarcina siciliae HI350]|uniref:Homocitrate synthase 1 n=1 Tax=Methanosarcina siciliae HI350 TaxID=1434119 RepID=A0A0E3PFS1_9EURY|nr:LeuA family protein [Methanosarcina siciliae]AKB33587.1 Homocitrate synthase 1 [Methanosarcina siciliae HI350]